MNSSAPAQTNPGPAAPAGLPGVTVCAISLLGGRKTQQDVLGFIRHGGRDCLLCGDWKVYADADSAARTFARFRKCKEVYARLFQSGCPLARLTVAARPA